MSRSRGACHARTRIVLLRPAGCLPDALLQGRPGQLGKNRAGGGLRRRADRVCREGHHHGVGAPSVSGQHGLTFQAFSAIREVDMIDAPVVPDSAASRLDTDAGARTPTCDPRIRDAQAYADDPRPPRSTERRRRSIRWPIPSDAWRTMVPSPYESSQSSRVRRRRHARTHVIAPSPPAYVVHGLWMSPQRLLAVLLRAALAGPRVEGHVAAMGWPIRRRTFTSFRKRGYPIGD
jgi:hypothetical protein